MKNHSETYNNWQIENAHYNGYEAYSLIDCDAYMLFDNTVEGLKTQIDEK